MEEKLVCYRFQCPRYPCCALARGKGCCLESDPQETVLPEDACTKENGYPYYQEQEERPVLAWMRRT